MPYDFFYVVTLVETSFFLLSGVYILTKKAPNSKAKNIAAALFMLGLYYLFILLARTASSKDVFNVFVKSAAPFGVLGSMMWMRGSYVYLSDFINIKGIWNFLKNILTVLTLIVASLLSFTNYMIDSNYEFNETNYFITNWRFHPNKPYIILIVITIVMMFVSFVNYVKLGKVLGSRVNKIDRYLFLLANFTALIGVVIMLPGYYFATLSAFPIEFVGEFFIFFGLIILLFGLVNRDHLLLEGVIEKKEFWIKAGLIAIFSIIYSFLVIGTGLFLETKLIAVIVGCLVIITHMSIDWVFDSLYSRLTHYNFKLYSSVGETAFILRNFDRLNVIETIELVKNEKFVKAARKKNEHPVVILREIVKQSVVELKPADLNKRTSEVLKYEVLRMIVDEGAKESSIMWDLGFDSSSRLAKLQNHPRFEVKSNSEYKATSIMSFRRIKQSAIEKLTIKLNQKLKTI